MHDYLLCVITQSILHCSYDTKMYCAEYIMTNTIMLVLFGCVHAHHTAS